MKDSLGPVQIAGVKVGVHWSVLGIVAIVAVGLATALFPAQFPEYSGWAYAVAAVITTLVFVASLLAHELGHAVVASRNGIRVEGITLWLLGGIASLQGEARTPGVDFRVAAIGPAISFALGGVFAVAGAMWAGTGSPGLAAGVLAYLAGINILLAVFNLVPAAPLDGGRILRAILWRWRGDRAAAQIWSARAGRGFGFVLILLGVVQILTGNLGAFWWILVGLFVVTLASAEEQQSRLGTQLSGVRVRDVMSRDPDTADGEETVEDFLHRVALVRRHSAFPIRSADGSVAGLVTLNRIRAVAAAERPHKTLGEIACPANEVPFAEPDTPLTELLARLNGCADGRALVVDEEQRLIGIVSPSDINRAVTLNQLGVGVREPASGSVG